MSQKSSRMVVQGHGLWLLVCVLFFPLQSTDIAQSKETLGSVFQLRDVSHT